jgi:hypothetical protein
VKLLKLVATICIIAGLVGIAWGIYQEQQKKELYLDLHEGPHVLIDVNNDGKINATDFDVDGNGRIDMGDITIVAGKYGAKVGDSKYDKKCDFNGDGIIGRVDIDLIEAYFGYSGLSLFNIGTTTGQAFIGGIVLVVVGAVMLVYSRAKGGKTK